ncbi:hypothetical protein [Candidatus Pantoea persica]|uniref:hypothetical protein n=1 Tax=Candidatus Pantoea persica TaxID=2518128 RepID=UPI00215D6D53|nr:hypothetical protein [Candidatus Pantoea persica]
MAEGGASQFQRGYAASAKKDDQAGSNEFGYALTFQYVGCQTHNGIPEARLNFISFCSHSMSHPALL